PEAGMSENILLSIDGLTVSFGGLTAVRNLSFGVERGHIHALIGPNGAGKSTTFNCISRYYNPSAGAVRVDGADITYRAASQIASLGLARTFQNLEMFNELSVLENVLLGTYSYSCKRWSALLRTARGETREFAESLLERVGLADFRRQTASNLDFGRQKMLELARALAIQPTLL